MLSKFEKNEAPRKPPISPILDKYPPPEKKPSQSTENDYLEEKFEALEEVNKNENEKIQEKGKTSKDDEKKIQQEEKLIQKNEKPTKNSEKDMKSSAESGKVTEAEVESKIISNPLSVREKEVNNRASIELKVHKDSGMTSSVDNNEEPEEELTDRKNIKPSIVSANVLNNGNSEHLCRTKSQTVSGKKKNMSLEVNSMSESMLESSIDPAILDRLLKVLEGFNGEMKERIFSFNLPIIYLLNEKKPLKVKVYTFLDLVFKKLFNLDWISVYMENDLKTPIYTSNNFEKIQPEFVKKCFEMNQKNENEEVI